MLALLVVLTSGALQSSFARRPSGPSALRLVLPDAPTPGRAAIKGPTERRLQRVLAQVRRELQRFGFRLSPFRRAPVVRLFWRRAGYRAAALRSAPEFATFDGFVRGTRVTSYLVRNSWSSLYHELVHLALSASAGAVPRWAEEGLADLVAARVCAQAGGDRRRASLPVDRLAQRVSGLLYNDALPIAALWSAKRSEFTGPRAERYYALAALLLAYLAEETARSKSTLAVRLAGLSDALHRRKIDGKAFRAFVLRHYAARDKQLDLLRQPPCSWQSSILSNWHLGAKSWSGVNGTTIERPLLPRRRFELRLAGRLRSGHLLIRLGSSYDRDPSDLWRLRIERTAFHLGRADRRAAKTRRWTRPDTPEFELRLRFDERQVQLVVGGAVRVTFARRHNFVSLLRVENRGEVEIRRLLLVE